VNDAQHTSPETYKETSKTMEFTAWQTKVSSAADISSRPMPLISTKDSLTGVAWWLPLSEYMKSDIPAGQDYMLPAPNKTRTQFRKEPATSQQVLRWIRLILTQKGLLEEIVDQVTLGSLRVWMPDLAYQAGVPRDRRRYLGRWAFDSTADVYIREHRAVVTDIWQEVLKKMPTLAQSQGRVPESDSQDEPEESPAVIKQSNKKPQLRPALVLSTERSDYRDIPESLGGPGQLVVAKKASKNSCPKLHIRLQTGV